jgi:hypothetical protein
MCYNPDEEWEVEHFVPMDHEESSYLKYHHSQPEPDTENSKHNT